ncbi:MAG TPA: hypothetical protein H9881_00770 [Candidatus Stackebrandtia excrementipullorum]|nr:hypothetical protein [Candidatus Stackebrandtia excrementipullorum]
MTASPVLPLRPFTVGEVLDTAAALLRSRWRALVTMALGLAVIEQVFMTWLRMATVDRVLPRYFGQIVGDWGMAWLWIVVGLTFEIFMVTLLSGPATRTAVAAVTGEPPQNLSWWTLTSRQWGYVVSFSVLLAVAGALAAAACVMPWFVVYALFGLVVPSLIADGLSPWKSFARSPQLFGRSGVRTGAIRFLSWSSWQLIRLAVTCAAFLLLQYVDFSTVLFDYFLILLGLVYAAVNTAAYAMMACVDAVIHVEARVRTEGLDVAVGRMKSRGEPIMLTAPEAS